MIPHERPKAGPWQSVFCHYFVLYFNSVEGAELIGEILRKRREELGIDLREVANTLRIQYEYLKSLENNALEKLPPQVYTRGYIREYARFLNVDPEPLLNEYAEGWVKTEEVEPVPPQPAKRKPALPRFAVFGFVIVAAISIAAISLLRNRVPPSGPARESGQIAPAETPRVPLVAAEKSKTQISHPDAYSRYVLNAVCSDASWLRVQTGEGKIEETLMKPGEMRKWTSQKGFDIKLGNAGGVKLVLNGRDLGTLGEKGRVVRLSLPQEDPLKASVDTDNR